MGDAPRNVRLLFAARIVRMFAYGLLGVVLVLYLAARGLDEARIGLLLTLTFLGDAVVSLWLSTHADRWGRRKALLVGAALMLLGGVVMALTGDFILLTIAATIGVISPTGNEVGPFLAVEQAGLAQVVPATERTRFFAWYNLMGYAATAVGALVAGVLSESLQHAGWSDQQSYAALFWAYGGLGLVIAGLIARLDGTVEAPARARAAEAGAVFGLRESRGTVLRLSALFSVDAFAGGFIVQSFLVYWFHVRFGVGESALGGVFFGTNLLSGLSALAAVPLARRIGLVNTMVFTHLPSNVLLMLVPLMPSFGWAAAVLWARHMISQMDVPTRQSYVSAVVPEAERSAANGVTGTARQLGTALAPLCAGVMPAAALLAGGPFFFAGGLKIVYDLALWRSFRRVKPPEEQGPRRG
ncbi:MAG: MFS transporter [Opitutae bacterium]|nr:MFS transporter [Opitutae bacterium]